MTASTSAMTNSAAASMSYPSGQAVTSARMSSWNADRFSFSRRFSSARRLVYPSGRYGAKAATIEDGVAPSWVRASQGSNRSHPFDRWNKTRIFGRHRGVVLCAPDPAVGDGAAPSRSRAFWGTWRRRRPRADRRFGLANAKDERRMDRPARASSLSRASVWPLAKATKTHLAPPDLY